MLLFLSRYWAVVAAVVVAVVGRKIAAVSEMPVDNGAALAAVEKIVAAAAAVAADATFAAFAGIAAVGGGR